jgi:hypothetical protein
VRSYSGSKELLKNAVVVDHEEESTAAIRFEEARVELEVLVYRWLLIGKGS